MHFKQAAAATVLVSTLIVISGCSSAKYGIAALDREAAAEDRLPDVVIDESVNADSVRKVAEQHQVAYFVGVMNDDQGYCAYAVDNDDVIGGCGRGHGQLVTVSLVMDSYDSADLKRDNWVEVHTNILIR